MHIFRPHADFLGVLLVLAPLLCAALIAVSRLEDHRHDVYDVTVGSALGLVVAYSSYRRYYPSLRSRRCDEPYPSRAERGAAGNKRGKGMDEEERVGSVDDDEDGDEGDSEHVPLRDASMERGRGRSHSD